MDISTRRSRPRKPVIERVMARVVKPNGEDGCWLWNGWVNRDGYGRIVALQSDGKWRQRAVHREVYQGIHGHLPRELCVCHRCDVPLCVNPSHLFVGTIAENNRDMFSKGRGRPPTVVGGPGAPRAKLSAEQVQELRRLYAGGMGSPTLGRRFGLATGAAWKIATRRSYVDVP